MTARSGRVVLQRRPAPAPTPWPAIDVGLAAAAAAAVVLGTSAGDAFVAVVALLIGARLRAGLVAATAIAATVARWGTADLGAVAGDQAVLGPAVLAGDAAACASSALAAVALLLVARRGSSAWPLLLPAAFGLGAAALAAGPAATSGADLAVRVVASAGGVAAAGGVALLVERRPRLDDRLLAAGALAAIVALALGGGLMRTGAGWDAVAVVGLVAPLAGLAVPLTGAARRHAVVGAGRWGALVGAAAWVLVVAAGAAPSLGGFAPLPPAAVAAAGTLLVAAGLATDRAGDGLAALERPPPAAALAPVLATAVVLVLGLVDGPVAPTPGAATAWLLGGALAATICMAGSAARDRGSSPSLAALLVPAGLLVAIRAAPSLAEDPSEVAGLAAAGVAAALGAAVWRRRSLERFRPAVATALVAAVGLSPVAAVRPWLALVAAGAGLLAVPAGPWVTVALAPGIGLAAGAAADVPAAGVGAPAHLLWAALALVATVGLVAPVLAPVPGARHHGSTDDAVAVEVAVATAALVGWLVLAPGAWRWAVPTPAAVAPWDRAAAAAAAGALLATAAHVVLQRRPWRAPDRRPDGASAGAGR